MGSTVGSSKHHARLKNYISWFEVPVYDIHRAAAFYNAIYGIEMEISVNGEFGMADGYGGKPLPFFKNFYAGGVDSIRGFEQSSLGPRDTNGDFVGGNRRVVGNVELLFPMPGVKTDKSVRLSVFADIGNVFGAFEEMKFGDLRSSVGIGVSWFSPVGPLKFSLAKPLKQKPEDKVERFQFLLGRVF